MIVPSFDLVLDSVQQAGAAALATADPDTKPGRKQQLPLVGLSAYEEAVSSTSLPPFEEIKTAHKKST